MLSSAVFGVELLFCPDNGACKEAHFGMNMIEPGLKTPGRSRPGGLEIVPGIWEEDC